MNRVSSLRIGSLSVHRLYILIYYINISKKMTKTMRTLYKRTTGVFPRQQQDRKTTWFISKMHRNKLTQTWKPSNPIWFSLSPVQTKQHTNFTKQSTTNYWMCFTRDRQSVQTKQHTNFIKQSTTNYWLCFTRDRQSVQTKQHTNFIKQSTTNYWLCFTRDRQSVQTNLGQQSVLKVHQVVC